MRWGKQKWKPNFSLGETELGKVCSSFCKFSVNSNGYRRYFLWRQTEGMLGNLKQQYQYAHLWWKISNELVKFRVRVILHHICQKQIKQGDRKCFSTPVLDSLIIIYMKDGREVWDRQKVRSWFSSCHSGSWSCERRTEGWDRPPPPSHPCSSSSHRRQNEAVCVFNMNLCLIVWGTD